MLGTREKSGASFTTRCDETVGVDCSVALNEKLELLSEKRTTIREAALKYINSTLSMRICGHCVESRQEHLADALHHILQRADEKEALLALRCVSLASVSLYEGTAFYKKMETVLTRMVAEETPVSASIRAAAIDALALVCFMNSTDSGHVEAVSYKLSGILYEDGNNDNTSDDVLRAAIEGWTLLLTTVDDSLIKETLFPENIEKLNELLDHSNNEVRIAAGRSFAVLVEALRNEERRTQAVSDFEAVDLHTLDSLVSWEEILEKLDHLSAEKLKAQSKVDGKKQKRAFRELVASVENGEPPHESLSIREVQLELDSWTQITQLDRLRTLLGEGFILHMIGNNNMMNIFDYHVNPDPTPVAPQFTKRERRRSIIEAEKEYTKFMGSNRRLRQNDLAGFASE